MKLEPAAISVASPALCHLSRFAGGRPAGSSHRIGWLALVGAWLCAASSLAADARLNVLLLVSDDQRPDTIRALGNEQIETPHLDRLVREGTVFRRALCANPVCVPSRAELLSGLTSFHNGFFRDARLRADVTTWPQVMQRAGYRTCYVGKWHTAGRPSERGYAEVDGLFGSGKAPATPQLDRHGRPVTGYVGWQFQTDRGERFPERGTGLSPDISAEFADAAIRQLRRQTAETRPFFLHVNFTAPHDPLYRPSGYEQRYRAEQLQLPANFRAEHPFDHGNLRGRDELLLPFPRTPPDVLDELAVYYAVITHLDQQIGRILHALEELQLSSQTLVIFTSDHGLALGSHGLRGKQNMYEHTINVPLIFRGPGIEPGGRRDAQCYLRDLFPTVCELAGVPVPPLDGRSLVPVLRTAEQEIYPFVVGYFTDAQRMIRERNWKLVRYPLADREQLFDLDTDPHELRNRIDDPLQAERADRLRGLLAEWLARQSAG